MKRFCFLAVMAMLGWSCIGSHENRERWNFDNLDGWEYVHQDKNPNKQYGVNDGILKIYTTANSRDRKKIKTIEKKYTSGTYRWRTYIPQMGVGDQASVGSWIYCDDHHELDFEVGYGKKKVREKLKAADDEMIAYMTSQDFPFTSVPVPIKCGWHIFEIKLTLVDGHYHATWSIDDIKKHEVQTTFGLETAFHIFCSVENLLFIGDHIPTQDNYGLYDFVEYIYHE